MKRFPILLLSLAACVPAPKAAPWRGRLSPDEIVMASKPAMDPKVLKAGQWVLMKVNAAGDAVEYTTKIQVTSDDEASVWIEHKVPSARGLLVFKSKIARDGTLLEGWVGEPGSSAPAKVYPPPGGNPPEAAPEAPPERMDWTMSMDGVTVAGKYHACAKLERTVLYPDGRRTTLTELYSPKVPFVALRNGEALGGLVRRETDRFVVQLVDFGFTGQEELRIPK